MYHVSSIKYHALFVKYHLSYIKSNNRAKWYCSLVLHPQTSMRSHNYSHTLYTKKPDTIPAPYRWGDWVSQNEWPKDIHLVNSSIGKRTKPSTPRGCSCISPFFLSYWQSFCSCGFFHSFQIKATCWFPRKFIRMMTIAWYIVHSLTPPFHCVRHIGQPLKVNQSWEDQRLQVPLVDNDSEPKKSPAS